MDSLHHFLAYTWFVLLGIVLVLYVVLDGFDLGVGVLSFIACDDERRSIMMTSLGRIRDVNETCLILLGGALFGAFPRVYHILLHALYLPIALMLTGLIVRAMAFELRARARGKPLWNLAFGAGSLLATLAQGFALGAVLQGIHVHQGEFAGGTWDWLRPFPALVAIGLTAGYTLLGATYLLMKTRGEVNLRSTRRARLSALVMMLAAIGVVILTPRLGSGIAHKWFTPDSRVVFILLSGVAVAAFVMLMRSLQRRNETAPFVWSVVIFLASFSGLALSIAPDIIPGAIPIAASAASNRTLVFLLIGIGILLPFVLIYNGYQYLVFRGKVEDDDDARHNAREPERHISPRPAPLRQAD